MKPKTFDSTLPIYLKSYPKYTTWDAPIDTYTLHTMWDDIPDMYKNNDAIAFMGTTLSFAEVQNEITVMTARLQKLGVDKGTSVGIFMANGPWYVICYYAILQAGGIVVNFNPLYAADELLYQIEDSNVEVMMTLDLALLYDTLTGFLGKGALQNIVVCPFDKHLPPVKRLLFNLLKSKQKAKVTACDTIHTIASIGVDLPPPTPVAVDVNDIAVLQYTGGTTGRAKGAVLTHANISANISQAIHWIPQFKTGEERLATFLPLFHVFAMTVCMNFAVKKKACMVMMPRFELKTALNLIAKQQVTMFPGVPTIFQAITQLPKQQRHKLKSVKIGMSGGAGLPVDTKTIFEQQTGIELVEGYGLSETSPIACANPFDGSSRAACIGMPMPQTKLSLRDLNDPEKSVPDGERGELCIKGPQVMREYWHHHNRDTFTSDGYFRSGDVAYFDENGFCYVVDRIKDVIICSGYNVYPRHVEEAIALHPDVSEVIVIGIADSYRGETPKAFISLQTGLAHTPTKTDILEFIKPHLSPMEMPTEIEFRQNLPKTIIGKLSKKDLREQLAKSQD